MKTRIGIDMDGVLIYNDPVWCEYYDSNFEAHNHRERYQTPPTWEYVNELCQNCFHDVVNNPEILSRAGLVDGAAEGVAELHSIPNTELWLISHRPPEITETATELLRRLNVLSYFTNLDWSWGNKLDICRRDGISILVDDGPKNIEPLIGTEVTPIVFDWAYNRHIKDVRRAHNWKEVVSLVKASLNSKSKFESFANVG